MWRVSQNSSVCGADGAWGVDMTRGAMRGFFSLVESHGDTHLVARNHFLLREHLHGKVVFGLLEPHLRFDFICTNFSCLLEQEVP